MESARPQDWARILEASDLAPANWKTLDECRAAVKTTGRQQRCLLIFVPPGQPPR
jgi:hypothetical protein